MEQFDVLIVGAANAGSFLARRLAESGHRVLVLEQHPKEKLGRKPELLRIARADIARYALPIPEEADDLAYTCPGGSVFSARNHYPKEISCESVGVYRFRYIARMNAWARAAGAEIRYQASFVDFLFENGRIAGAVYEQDGARHEVRAKLVADCSGAAAVARTKLPNGYGVENTPAAPDDLLYVTLRHIAFHDPEHSGSRMRSWPYYPAWEAPEGRADCAILGTWVSGSFDEGEWVFAAFQRAVRLPRYTTLCTERGMLPKRHPLNSFVADGFLVSGDAAYVAVSSSLLGFSVCMPQLVIAAEEISRLLTEGGYLSRARLWNINTRFFSEQGLALAVRNAMQPALLHTTASEDDFFFHHNLFFSEQTLSALWQGEAPVFSAKETLRDALALLGGVLTGKVRVAAAGWFIRNVQNGMRAVRLYAAYPASEARLDAWVSRAEAFWKKCRKTARS